MNDASVQQVPGHIASLVFRLLDGWRPVARPLGNPTRFVWAGEDMSSNARELVIQKDRLDVRAEDVATHFFDHERRDALRNKPFEGQLDDGSTFAAESAFLDMHGATGHYWTITHADRPASLWVASVQGLGSLRDGNLSVKRPRIGGDGSIVTHNHQRFDGAYTYFLIDAGGDGDTWFIVIDTGSSTPPTRDRVYPDVLGLQFVLGRAFYFDVLHGVDKADQVVALAGGRHGRDHGERGQTQSPVPFGLSNEHWPSPFFTAISATIESARNFVSTSRSRTTSTLSRASTSRTSISCCT